VVVVEVKEEGTNLSSLRGIHKCKSHKGALVVGGTVWGSKCFVQAPLQVVHDVIMEVVDVILIGVNGWGSTIARSHNCYHRRRTEKYPQKC
jgi:hypothetical protein